MFDIVLYEPEIPPNTGNILRLASNTGCRTVRKAAPMSTDPEAVAEDTVAALKRDAGVIWVPAPLRVVFAVFRHLPRVIWRRLPA